MKVVILSVGNVREPHYQAACQEYSKRLRPVLPVEVMEIPEEPLRETNAVMIQRALAREGQGILRKLKPDDVFVPLSPDGRQMDSPTFANLFAPEMQPQTKRLVFAIGSSHGLDDAVLARGQWCLSFGAMTFPHQLARVMLLEQIYRAAMILAGRPYHK